MNDILRNYCVCTPSKNIAILHNTTRCKVPLFEQRQSCHYPTHSGQDNKQSDKKGGCFHRHRKVWRILSDGELDFVPQQRRVSARGNVILNSVWWLTWIDSKRVRTVCLHMIIVTMGVYRQSSFDVFHDQDQQVSPHRQRKRSLLSITQQWLTQPATVATFSCEWNSWLVKTVG